ncbi:single-stranded-DNA-specific exonuclease RecJ [Sporosarcina thermotolerans]|uniref:Single-stranded-DNA-specific exonuclease RecJ n=1 Tax=Sporosarcina thermotolerans TaxID=633404 RepID=A0AAW9AG87_9BACL|nr:single-stranded-DNA-specific exonuclease RecJ [Sporosarcina thermotolerans]MDW0118076.1 single-stranded-DNA-specific exonuclease RecJ [Sporosarcina thermotolerans]WHT47572.1 single-stranded-DNA-specific exonuclease RecJ [Sporosarcina thermotolerans]
MIESMKTWTINRPDEHIVNLFMNELGIPSIHAKILVSRGITDLDQAKSFLHIDESCLHDPYLLFDMEKAVTRIMHAIERDEKITVYGDYDADGVTSVTVLTTALEQLGATVDFKIPNRFEHGYGPNIELFKVMKEEGTALIITVDNGISGLEAIAFAKSVGMDVIVTDHHEIGDELPIADAIIHPRHPEGIYPFGELAGVGVAFKLACALLGEVPEELFEIAAIGTVADLVPLKDENRYIVKEGIRRMRMSHRPGIQALTKVSGTEQSSLYEESLGFMIGPRINAPGRLGSANPAVHLLKTEDMMEAVSIAEQLDSLNKERQALVATIAEEAEQELIEMYGDMLPYVIVLAGEGWNPGVVGIVASRLTEKYYRPSIILSIDKESESAKGSGRSIQGFDLFKELSKNADLLPHFGGHEMAAGMSLSLEDVNSLRDRLNEQGKMAMTDDILTPRLKIDVPLEIGEIEVDVLEGLESLRPFGVTFEKPVFLIEDLSATTIRKIGANKNHLKLELSDGKNSIDIIGFGNGAIADEISPGVKLSVTGDLQVNEWNGRKKPQLLLTDLQSNERQLYDLRGIREPNRWISIIPQKNNLFIAFQEASIGHFQSLLKNVQIHQFGQVELMETDHVILLDMPESTDQLKELIDLTKPKRIYAHFHVNESVYFEGIPSREQFGWYYSFLKKRGTFDLRKQVQELSKHKGWKVDTIYFMTMVFSELGFVKIESGLASVQEDALKKKLSEAPSYQKRERQIELENKLVYAPYTELKNWFDEVCKETANREEQLWI